MNGVFGGRMLAAALGAALVLPAVSAQAAPPDAGWRVLRHDRIGGPGGWDYLALDATARRLYISRSDRVVVMDADTGRVVGEIDGLDGVHGVALAPALHRGFISNGHADTVSVFDPATLKVTQTIAVGGHNPDAIVFDPFSRRIFTFNGRSDNASVIDAATGKLLGAIALDGKPEFAVSDGHGRIYANIEDKAELVAIDPVQAKVLATWKLKDCEEPSGLALDDAHHRLFSVCQNRTMAVTDALTGKPVDSVPIGDGPDAARFDAARDLVFSSNGQSGTLTVVHEDDADHYRVLADVPTQKSARTMAFDTRSGRVYLSAAERGPRPAATPARPHPRPAVLPGSFNVVVVGN
ncbi:MAG TPA: YncE family protein [Rhodanobacteraceae bacterium]|nr:YncE family protein [Rhodanobacteraceae bacterium]